MLSGECLPCVLTRVEERGCGAEEREGEGGRREREAGGRREREAGGSIIMAT